MYQTAYNTGSQPLLADDLGRVIGGGEWGAVDTTSAAVKTAIKAQQILLVDTDDVPDGANPALIAAVALTADVNDRLDAIRATPKEDLKAALLEAPSGAESLANVSDDPAKATKAELVEAVAGRTDIDVTDTDAPSTTKQRGSGRSTRKD